MKIKENYVLRQVADTWVVLPLGAETLNFTSMLKLNDAGAMLWNVLEKGCSVETLVEKLLSEYEISKEQAEKDAEEFLQKLIGIGCVEV